ncbi:PDR/VanB family oxidoreductase [Rhodococcus jostii]|uniref:Ferredoxin-NADP reductase n=1 Tax=Rhodococcus jostii TaxID=132919 RepID=A0A1H5BSU3_RHOJO|nr:PDR/VanB family oxidoreductase [Rhodococcus jostii]SED57090.1 Ferredoxin-NADP reductase [Rhodococcus jostii]
MTPTYPAPTSVPGDLWGKRRRDPLLRAVAGVTTAYMRSLRFLYRTDLTPPVGDGCRRLLVRERRVVAHDENVVSLTLTAPGGGELDQWRPGAHLDLELPSGLRRQYSLCGDPADSRAYTIAVRRIPDGGGGSREVHDILHPGASVTVRGPFNAFPLALPGHGSTADRLHFVAGGIGITPILPMARLAHRLDLDWSMVYTGRNRESLPFLDQLAEFGDRVTVRTDDDGGMLPAAELLGTVSDTAAVYCCGPIPLIAAVDAALPPGTEFHYERFSPPPIVDGRQFEVELARTGEVVRVPADRTALDAISEVRPGLAFSCRQGFCGTCAVRVEDDSRTSGQMLLCVDRTDGERVVLDI